jgi:hypothetical protein
MNIASVLGVTVDTIDKMLSAQGTAAQAMTSSAAAAAGAVTSIAGSTSGAIGNMASKLSDFLRKSRELGDIDLPKFHAGGSTGMGQHEYLAKVRPREYMLDEAATRRAGGPAVLDAFQAGNPSKLLAALGQVDPIRVARRSESIPVSSGRGGGAGRGEPVVVQSTIGGPITIVLDDGTQLPGYIRSAVSRGNRERTISRQEQEEIV